MIRVFKLLGADWMRAPISGTGGLAFLVMAAYAAVYISIDRALLLAIVALLVLNGRDDNGKA